MKQQILIRDVIGREILDSRGNPTVEVEVVLENGAKFLPASVLYPVITGGSVVFSAITGRVLFKERISLRQALCMLLCILGTWLLIIK